MKHTFEGPTRDVAIERANEWWRAQTSRKLCCRYVSPKNEDRADEWQVVLVHYDEDGKEDQDKD